jgi:hypothetical protein
LSGSRREPFNAVVANANDLNFVHARVFVWKDFA